MKISILVPTLGNREQEINRLLESLDHQDAGPQDEPLFSEYP